MKVRNNFFGKLLNEELGEGGRGGRSPIANPRSLIETSVDKSSVKVVFMLAGSCKSEVLIVLLPSLNENFLSMSSICFIALAKPLF